MPITILELVVRATIKEEAQGTTSATTSSNATNRQEMLHDKQILIEEVVEQVLEIIHQKEER